MLFRSRGEVRDPQAFKQLRALVLGREAHVLGDGEVREQPVVLGEISDAAALRAEMDAMLAIEPPLTREHDPSGAISLQPSNGAQQRCLARARRADDRDALPAQAQREAKIEGPPGEGDIDFEEVHERTSSLLVNRIAALRMISSTPIATAWSRFASNRE